MGRINAYSMFRIDDKLCLLLKERMELEHRRGSLNAYVEEILDKYVNGFFVENEAYKKEIRHQVESKFTSETKKSVRKPSFLPKLVHAVGPSKGVLEHDEGKRKAS